ncbi:hypothetical protein AB0M28_37210 [Streptomyces sp. NPDC051940]|uniref:hypothetical protein n=1 Tax=Streptomyces sp. NPDC051940 TaxID=3155675 RepID=UPI0034453D43
MENIWPITGPIIAVGSLASHTLVRLLYGAWCRRRVRAGRQVRVWCEIHGFAPPYPRRFVRARAVLLPGEGVVELRPYGRDPLRVPCGGMALGVTKRRPGRREVDYLPAPGAGVIRLSTAAPTIGALLMMLAAPGPVDTDREPVDADPRPAPQPRPGAPVWRFLGGAPLVTLLLGAALWLPPAHVYGLGHTVTATVVTAPGIDGDCRITWRDPWDGTEQRDTRYCGDRKPGATIEVIALDWPLRGSSSGKVFPLALWGFMSAMCLLVGIIEALTRGIADARAWPNKAASPPVGPQVAVPPAG